MQKSLLALVVAASLLPAAASAQEEKVSPAAIEFFEAKIRPVLAEHCFQCHSSKSAKLKANLLLDTKAGLRKGGESGPAIVPGSPEKSLLLKALKQTDDLRMPPKGKLPDQVIADFAKWIALGAPDPRDGAAVAVKEVDWKEARDYWAFKPPFKHALPSVKDQAWPRKDIDHFLLAEMERRQLKPVRPATRLELIRRAKFDLIGLPPTPEEIDAFMADQSPAAYANLIDRLLKSPHYGERWGRYWLDLARFADDKALAKSEPYAHAHRYRDWVIQAFNSNMPYDRFVRLQLAGDMLPAEGPAKDHFVRLAGLGFQGLGAEYHKGNFAAQVMADELDDRVDTLTRGLLGLTVACARCHDHKYDPIPTLDYYSLAAAYQGSTLSEIPLSSPEDATRLAAWKEAAKEREAKLTRWIQERGRSLGEEALPKLSAYLLTAWQLQVLREHKIPHKEADLAVKQNLQVYFIAKVRRQLDVVEKSLPQLRNFAVAASKARAGARPTNGSVETPEALKKAADDLAREVQTALDGPDSPKKGKGPTPLLKALWLDPQAPFAVEDKDVPALLSEADGKLLAGFRSEIENDKKNAPPAPVMIHGVKGGGQAMRVHIRGNVERLGDPAPPGFLQVLARSDKPADPKKPFTRLELANAIATADNPLTARVIVNRVWQNHFGRGIVATASNFGKLGERPTHPELLDTLTVRFIESGWSIHWLHREIMLSAAYQLSSASDDGDAAKDVENRYLWRMTPRRLDFEAWRDSLLAVSGRLDATIGGPSFELGDPKTNNVRRTIYAKVSRADPNAMLSMFDFPDANVSSDRRSVTTVPQQQLFVLNSSFMIDTAKAFAARLEKSAASDEARIDLSFRLAYGRLPEAAEKKTALEFLRSVRPVAGAANPQDRLSAWEQYAHAILATNEFVWVE